ncbi:hypothetical protein [Prosthecobacter dejongeii]|uniref:Uncharacterized protein n=1 Tax=Prosthecobacter dejongeii TaxID=48465 RepID=A0A7W7YKG2_9BACT|nr:hypothetical protein [Prosthecobacter dejongeii]MBB5037855.1 hypothetical protein [Prosthecobacter dejongeii]
MSVRIVRYEDHHIPAVRRFNQRLAAGGSIWHFPEQSVSQWLPDTRDQEIVEHYYVAVEGDEIRGGYILKWQPFQVEGQIEKVSTLYLPLSEGVVNSKYNLLGLVLIRDALTRNPLTFCLGMGGSHRDLPKTLKMMGWQVHDIPFFFLPLRARPFLRNLQPVKAKRWLNIAAQIAANTGIASLGLACFHRLRRAPRQVQQTTTWELVESFGPWADELWAKACHDYSLFASRGQEEQNRLYAPGAQKSIRVLVREAGRVIGWFIARASPMHNHKYFGNMCVGSIIDAIAEPGQEGHIAWAARQFLIQQQADIIVANMQHESWRRALLKVGFLSGPSNFTLATSPKLSQRLNPYPEKIGRAQFMRGDGEGPSHL